MNQSRLNRVSEGDRDSMLELLLDNQQQLGRFVAAKLMAMPLGVDSVEDILQATYFAAFRSATTLRAQSDAEFYGWLKAIALNEIRASVRRAKTKKRESPPNSGHPPANPGVLWELVTELSDDGHSPSQFAARHEVVVAMQIAIGALPEEQQTAVRFHCIERLSLEETAEKMERSVGSVHGLVQRAKRSLREMMRSSTLWFSRKQ